MHVTTSISWIGYRLIWTCASQPRFHISPYLDMLPLFGHARDLGCKRLLTCDVTADAYFDNPLTHEYINEQIRPSDWSRAFFNDMHGLLIGYRPHKRPILLLYLQEEFLASICPNRYAWCRICKGACRRTNCNSN